jgi:hypothetical protein
MAISVNLWSRKQGEIRSFLEKYYEKDVSIDDDVDRWIYIYKKPLDAIDIISTLIDNNDKYKISMCIQIDKGDVHPVTYENHNDIIKGILCLFYEESSN